MRVDEDGDLEKSAYVTNLLVKKNSSATEINGGDDSYLNEKNEQQNRRIHTMVIAGLIGSYHHEK